MSVRVTYLKKTETNAGGTFGHTHYISQEDKSVPSEEEFENLSAKVEKMSSAIRDLKTQLSDIAKLKQTLTIQKKEIAKLTESTENFKKEIVQLLQTNISAGSPFFSRLSEIIQSHIENVQSSVSGLETLLKTDKKS